MFTRFETRRVRVLAVAAALAFASPARSAAPASSPDPRTGSGQAWRTSLGADGGDAAIDVVGDLVVARRFRGDTASFDLATGRRIAVLVGAPHGSTDSAAFAIDPYSETAVLHGALVGFKGGSVAAVDLRTGRPLWRTPASGLERDLYGYGAQLVEAGALDVVAFRGSILALDPVSGAIRWRKDLPMRPPDGYPEEDRGLWSCAGVVLRWMEGRLTALDARDGTQRWTAPTAGSSAPPVSCVGRRVVLAVPPPSARGAENPRGAGAPPPSRAAPGRLRVLDAASGAELSSISLPEGASARHVVAAGDAVVVAVDLPGATSHGFVAELELPAGRIRWRLELGGVLALRADDTAVYAATDLDGHLASYTRERYGLRWCVAVAGRPPAADEADAPDREAEWRGRVHAMAGFAVGKASGSQPRVVVPVGDHLVAFDPAPAGACTPIPTDPYLFVETVQERRPGPEEPRCRAVAVSWVDGVSDWGSDEKVLWRRELPRRFQEPYPCGWATWPGNRVHLRGTERLASDDRMLGPPGFDGIIELGDHLLLPNDRGLLAFDRRSGELVLDLDAPSAEQGGFYFDADGVFSLSGDPPCTGWAEGSRLSARCGDRVLYFNGTTAALVAGSPPVIEARATFDELATKGQTDEQMERSVARVKASGVPLLSSGHVTRAVVLLGGRELFLWSVRPPR